MSPFQGLAIVGRSVPVARATGYTMPPLRGWGASVAEFVVTSNCGDRLFRVPLLTCSQCLFVHALAVGRREQRSNSKVDAGGRTAGQASSGTRPPASEELVALIEGFGEILLGVALASLWFEVDWVEDEVV